MAAFFAAGSLDSLRPVGRGALSPRFGLVLLDVLTTPYLAMPFFDDQVLGGSCSLVELGLV